MPSAQRWDIFEECAAQLLVALRTGEGADRYEAGAALVKCVLAMSLAFADGRHLPDVLFWAEAARASLRDVGLDALALQARVSRRDELSDRERAAVDEYRADVSEAQRERRGSRSTGSGRSWQQRTGDVLAYSEAAHHGSLHRSFFADDNSLPSDEDIIRAIGSGPAG